MRAAGRPWRPTVAQVVILLLVVALVAMSAEAHLAYREAREARLEAAAARVLARKAQVDVADVDARLDRLERRRGAAMADETWPGNEPGLPALARLLGEWPDIPTRTLNWCVWLRGMVRSGRLVGDTAPHWSSREPVCGDLQREVDKHGRSLTPADQVTLEPSETLRLTSHRHRHWRGT